MKFEWNPAAPLDGELLYRRSEYSIDFEVASPELLAERVGTGSNTSLSFGTLQVEIGIENGDLLYPWGLFPNTRWQAGSLSTPDFQPGRLRLVSGGEGLQIGVSVSFPASDSWPIVWDQRSGWICIGSATQRWDTVAVEYAKNAAIVLVDRQLISLWLRPTMTT